MSGTALQRLSLLGGRTVSQIGIVVADLEEAVVRYESLWGGGPWRCFRYGADSLSHLAYRGRPAEFAVTIALNASVPQVELLQVDGGPSVYDELLERRGEGLHHLGFWVDSLDEAISSMADAGYELLQVGKGTGLDGDGGFAYFDTERDFSVLLEAIEVPARRREPDFVWPTPAA